MYVITMHLQRGSQNDKANVVKMATTENLSREAHQSPLQTFCKFKFLKN